MDLNLTAQQRVYYILRLAAAMCFIGHGAFGIITKPIWCNYFAVFGLGHSIAYQLMPIVGVIDIMMGLTMLFYPIRLIALWLVFWGVITASLRPLSGEPLAELIERAGNFGAPLALLLLCGGSNTAKGWFTKIAVPTHTTSKINRNLKLCLKAAVFLLLIGHGWLNLIAKKGLITQYAALGFTDPLHAAYIFGIAETAAAFTVWIDALSPLLLLLFLWKMATELLYPHYELFEFVERGGSYGTLLSLWILQHRAPKLRFNSLVSKPAFH